MEKGEKGEQAFVPQWLKGSGNGGSVNSNHYFGSSLLSDEHGSTRPSRNRLPVSACDHDAPRTNSFRRTLSSNGSMNIDRDNSSHARSYSSFGRSHRDRDREKDPDRDRHFFSDSTDLLATSRNREDIMRRSLSMALGKPGESLPKSLGSEKSNGVISVGHRATFDKEFPSLVVDEKHGNLEKGRVSSPGLTSAVQNLPFTSAPLPGVDRWTSALAEVPQMSGVIGAVISSTAQTAPVAPVSTVSVSPTGLNMAETVAQVPSRIRTVPQIPDDNQRVEERSRRQCTLLRPMTPSMSKSSAINLSEKPKTKGARGGDMLVNHALRAPSRSDAVKTSPVGNLQVLNRERSVVSPTAKDAQTLTNASRVVNPVGPIPSAAAPPPKNSINPKVKPDGRGNGLSHTQSFSGEKRVASQAQKRNAFFNSLRQKSSMNHAAGSSNPSTSSNLEKGEQAVGLSSDSKEKVLSASSSGMEGPMENGNGAARGFEVPQEPEELVQDNREGADIISPEEEAFLTMLGWKKDDREQPLTPEEIAAFVEQHLPSGKLPHLQSSFVNGSELRSSDSA